MPNRDEAAQPQRRSRFMAIYWTGVAGLTLVGAIAERIVVPAIIAMVHSGRGPAFLGRLMPGRDHASVASYVASWHDFTRRVTPWFAGLLLVVGLGLLLWRTYRAPAETADPEPPSTVAPTDLFLLVLWFGVLTGLGEGLYLAAKLLFWHEVVVNFWHAGTPSIWMAPLATTILGITVGLGLLIALHWRRPAGVLRWTAFGGIFLLLLTWITMTARLHWIAALLVALGLALRFSPTMAGQPRATARMVRRSLPAFLVTALLLGVGERTEATWKERRAVAALPSAVPGAPNVIMIVLDTERAASLSLYGYGRPTTPFLEELASRAVVFDRAIAPENWTLPSHGTLFTSHFNTELEVGTTPLNDRFPTLAEVLRDRGYLTSGFVANLRFLNDELWGLARGFDHWSDQPLSPAMVVASSRLTRSLDSALRFLRGDHTRISKKTAEQVNREFFAWRDRVAGRPYFAFFNYFDVHNPYLPTKHAALPTTSPTPRYWLIEQDMVTADQYTADEIRDLRESYEAATRYLDDRLRELFAGLEARGDLENVLVIITSDHGEQFGEHGLMEHRNSYYLPLLHVPLLIIPPGGHPAGIRIEEPVGLADLPVTISHLVGISPTPFLGASLARYWSDDPWPGVPRPIFSGKYDLSIVRDQWHYIRTLQGEEPGQDVEELYDDSSDPDEETNLARTIPAPPILFALRAEADSIGAKRPQQPGQTGG